MIVSVIIVNFNGAKHTLNCVESIRAHAPSFPFEIIVVDNKSSDSELAELKRGLSGCTLLLSEKNLGFGGANNLGAGRAGGEMLFFLNNDTILTSDVMTPLRTRLLQNPRAGMAGPALLNPDGTFQVSFGVFPSLTGEWRTRRIDKSLNRQKPELVAVEPWMRDWVTGAAMMVRKECFDRIGGFDERYFMYFEDADLCYRASRLGYEIDFAGDCSLIHLGGMSHPSAMSLIQTEYRRSQLRFYDKFRSWPERLLLRVYLISKMLIRFVIGQNRQSSAAVIRLVFHFPRT